MNRTTKLVGVVLGLMAMAFFAGWPSWKWVRNRPVSDSLYQRTKALAEKDPQLKLAWVVATQDDMLTWPEAKVIVEAAGEKIDPE